MREAGLRRPRLEDAEQHFSPWRRAARIEDASLFWMPVSAFPLRSDQKRWISEFFSRFGAGIERQLALKTEHFLQLKVIYPDLSDAFLATSQKLLPYQGLSRRPFCPVIRPLAVQQIEEFMKGGSVPSFNDAAPDLCFWFLKPDAHDIHTSFLGCGGYTQIWLPQNPLQPSTTVPINKKTREHPAFQGLDIDGTVRATYALAHPFQAASKALFGQDLKNDPSVSGLPFVIPLLRSADVFAAGAETRRQWLDLMPIYANESREDSGIVLFGECHVEGLVRDVVADLEDSGFHYALT